MKKILAITALLSLMAASPVLAEQQTMFTSEIGSGWFFGPTVKYTQIDETDAVLLGGHAGWIIDHKYVIGFGMYGLASDIKDNYTGKGDPRLNMGYGGLELSYIARSDRLVHITVDSLVGAGALGFSEEDSEGRGHMGSFFNDNSDTFFIVEPGVNVVFNVTEIFRLSLGASYRFVEGVAQEGIYNKDIGGPAVTINLKFGKF